MWGEIFIGACLGLILGSFAGALSYRLVRDQDWISQRSRCPDCGMRLGPVDLIPLLGYALRKGRCAHCGQAISPRYPIIEALCSLACMGATGVYGLGIDGLVVMVLSAILIGLAAADFEAQILPDELQIALAGLGALFAYLHNQFWTGLLASILGLSLGLLLRWFYRRFRGLDALGLGDVKFFAAAGFWLGVQSLSLFLGLAAVFGLGLAVATGKGMQDRIPFGVALALSLFMIIVSRPFFSPI